MADSAKVIHLQPEVQLHVRSRLSRLSKPATAVHERSKKLIAASFIKFFEAVDDAMFELADDATSNEDQNLFFDSMREVRVQRQAIEKRFQESIDEAFARLVAGDQRDQMAESGELTADALSLIQNDDLEQLVAFEAATQRANAQFAEPLTVLSHTLDIVVSASVTPANLPVGPQFLNHAIMAEIKRLDVSIKAKLVLFDVFEKVVVAAMGAFCKYLGTVLEGAGVEAVAAKPVKASFQAADEQIETAADREALLELLNFIQKLPVNGEPDQDIAHLLDEVQKRRQTKLNVGLVERETIKLVTMLFDFVLRDPALAVSMRELICRLKIPILKVALLDAKFLENKHHAARCLLNDMASTAMGWQPDLSKAPAKESESLFGLLSSIVNRIVRDFDRDIDIFKAMLIEFRTFREKEQKRTSLIEKRTVDAEAAKAKAQLARKTVRAELDSRTMNRAFPPVVNELIFGPWANVLFVTGQKKGLSSIEWAEALKLVSDLVASVQAVDSREEKQKRIALAPDVIKRLRRGLDSISFNPFEVSEHMQELERIHMALLRGDKPQAREPERKPTTSKASAPKVDNSESGSQPVRRKLELKKDDPFMMAVAGFMPGAWFDLNGQGDAQRCRLAAVIKATGKYIFVNRSGAKVAEHSQLELALKFQNGDVKPVDNGSLFDRALENVVSNMRETKSRNKMNLDDSSSGN